MPRCQPVNAFDSNRVSVARLAKNAVNMTGYLTASISVPSETTWSRIRITAIDKR